MMAGPAQPPPCQCPCEPPPCQPPPCEPAPCQGRAAAGPVVVSREAVRDNAASPAIAALDIVFRIADLHPWAPPRVVNAARMKEFPPSVRRPAAARTGIADHWSEPIMGRRPSGPFRSPGRSGQIAIKFPKIGIM